MNTSYWGFLFVILGVLGIILINIFGEITIKNEQNYYSLKEVTKSAMQDAIDEYAYASGVGYDGITQLTDPESMHCISGKSGEVRIIKERFVELFLVKFAQSVDTSNDYIITFNDIDECPPKVTVTVTSTQSFSMIERILGSRAEQTEDAEITNVLTGILESDDPFE